MLLTQDYRQKVLPAVMKRLGLKNINQVPQIDKVIVNVGIGSYIQTKDKDYEAIVARLAAITGQQPVVIKAKLAVSNFKLRKGMPNGVKVTLRGERMLHFLDRLIHVALPRTRDFRGVSKKAFDKEGNYSMGIKEITIFPEITLDDLTKMHGLQINVSTTANDKESAQVLLEEIGVPFAK